MYSLITIEICTELDLHWYCVCGTALGAVKYKGYIPWDDDIDVALPRPDYEHFLQEAPKRLPEHIFIQNYRTDPEFPHTFTKLRNSKTTQIEVSLVKRKMNHGIYIDIFPLDGYPRHPLVQTAFELRKRLYTWARFTAFEEKRSFKSRIRNNYFRMLCYHKNTAKVLAKAEKMYTQYPVDGSRYWCNFGNWQGKLEYADREQYGKGTHAVFEGMDVIIPENFDAYLTQKYGDWRSDPLIEKQVSHHIFEVVDVERPYTHYIG